MSDLPTGMWIFLAVVWVSGLGFAAYIVWLRHTAPQGDYKAEFQKLRDEMSTLAMAVGLRRREQQQHQGPSGPMIPR